jgi:chemotaxis protein methyltransferase CheR
MYNLEFNDDFYFNKLKKKLVADIDFQSHYYVEKHLKRRFMVRMRALEIDTFRDYIKKLEREPDEYDNLVKTLTVNVTEWFRDQVVFDVFRKHVLREIISRKKNEKSRVIRIWSAGCSDGKEPYSIAMLLHDALGEDINNFYAVIHATDIDEEMLRKASRGWYASDEMEGVKDPHLRLYFTQEDGGYRVKPTLSRRIRFEKADLTANSRYHAIDAIFCRNVVIYLTKELKERLYMDFYDAVNQGGYLVLGKTEILVGEARSNFAVVDNRNRIYQKI